MGIVGKFPSQLVSASSQSWVPMRRIPISEDRWSVLAVALREPKLPAARVDERDVMEAILWVLLRGKRWRDLNPGSPSGVTCWRRLRVWREQGAWPEIWERYVNLLDREELLMWTTAMLGWLMRDPSHVRRSSESWREDAVIALIRRSREVERDARATTTASSLASSA